jgi:nitrate reductase (NAD(P)H)
LLFPPGAPLLPDHGYPIRVIIPGYVGGRQVKWLKKITVTKESSDNHYHLNDNRVLPPSVTLETAASSGWFGREETLLNEMNLNSVIVFPQNEEWLSVDETVNHVYEMRGYAYSGGGRPIVSEHAEGERGFRTIHFSVFFSLHHSP